MIEARWIYADAPPGEVGTIPAGWYVYKGTDQGGTLWVLGIIAHRKVIERFIQFWADHRPMVRTLCLAWADELQPILRDSSPRQREFVISFNEHLVLVEDPDDPSSLHTTVSGWHVFNGHDLFFLGDQRFRSILERTVNNLIQHLRPGSVIVAWTRNIRMETWYSETE